VALGLLGLVVGAGAAAYLLWWAPGPGDARDFVPADTRTALVVPDIRALHDGLRACLAGVEGATGLLDLASAELGIDVSSPEALEAQGIAPEGSLVLYGRGSAWVLNLSVTSLPRFGDLVAQRTTQGLGAQSVYGPHSPRGMEGAVRLPAGLGLAWGAPHHRGVATVLLVPQSDGLDAAWLELAAAPSGPVAGAPQTGMVWGVLDAVPSFPVSLGPMALVLSSYLSPLSRWTGSLDADGRGLRLAVDVAWQGKGAPPLSFFHAQPQGKALRTYLPRSTTALVSMSWRPQSLANLPRWMRAAVLPTRLPGLAGAVLPPTKELLELVHGDMALALFGLSRTHTVDLARLPTSLTEIVTRALGVGLLIRAADGQRVAAALAGVAEGLAERGWTVTAIREGPWTGFDLQTSRPPQRWALVARDDVVALVSADELAALTEVAKGEAAAHKPPGGTSAEHPTIGVHVSFGRVARELATRGVPPYFLTMLSGVEAAGLQVRLHEKGVHLSLEVGL
jgi:hypothetical protein